jgi:hypothetical protein
MKAHEAKLVWGTALAAAWQALACGSDGDNPGALSCGPGTEQRGGQCVPTAPDAGNDADGTFDGDPDAQDSSTTETGSPDPPCAKYGKCPALPMVSVAWPADKGGTYLIDETETWLNDYFVFIEAAKLGQVPSQLDDPECAWNFKIEWVTDCVGKDIEAAPPEKRVGYTMGRCANWCDAKAYCAWVGKRLCTDEDPLEGVLPNPKNSEWYNACSNQGLDPGWGVECPNSCEQCGDGYPGVFSMKAGDDEWTGKCNPVQGSPYMNCLLRIKDCGDSQLPVCATRYITTNRDRRAAVRCCK